MAAVDVMLLSSDPDASPGLSIGERCAGAPPVELDGGVAVMDRMPYPQALLETVDGVTDGT